MSVGLLWLIPLFTLTEGTDGFLQVSWCMPYFSW